MDQPLPLPPPAPPHWYRQRAPQLALAVLIFLLPLIALPAAWSQAVQRQPLGLRGQSVKRLESVASGGVNLLYTELAGGVLLRSLDGRNFGRIDTGLPHLGLGWTSLIDWQVRRGSPTQIVALVEQDERGRLFASDDGGDTWHALPLPEDSAGDGMWRAVALSGDSNLLLAGARQVWASDDGGQNWQTAGLLPVALQGVELLQLRQDGQLAGLLFASAGEGIWISRDGGSAWQIAPGVPPLAEIGALAVAPDRGGLVYAGGRGLVFVSADSGENWRAAELPGATGVVQALFTDPRVGETVLAADGAGSLYRSDDSGETWSSGQPGVGGSCQRAGAGSGEPRPALLCRQRWRLVAGGDSVAAHGHADGYCDRHRDANLDTDCDANCNCYRNGHANGYRDGHSHSNADSHRQPDRHPIANAHACAGRDGNGHRRGDVYPRRAAHSRS